MTRPLELGFFLPIIEDLRGSGGLARWSELRELARLAEAVGFDAVHVPDHLIFRASAYWGIPEGETRGTWEAWTVLSALAAATTRVRLGTFVACNSFRNPALLAKMASTLDEVSGGRLSLGLGAGSHAPEYTAFGYPFDHLAGRFDEALQIIVPLLRQGRVDFQGRYYSARDCELRPTGPTPGGPPIWIAAFGPRLLRLTARWADAFVTAWYADPAQLAAPFTAFADACAEVGRDPAGVGKTVGVFVSVTDDRPPDPLARGTIRGTPEAIAGQLLAFGAAGATHVTCMLDPRDRTGLERFAPVIESLRRLEAAGAAT